MTRAFTILLTCLLLLMPFAASAEAEDTLTLFLATDLHYLAPELTDHGAYFEKITSRGDGKVMAYSEELVEAFVAQVIDRHPDALILSGDLTFEGECASHEALADKLSRITAAGIPVMVLPGNHDLNNPSAARYAGEGHEQADNVTSLEFLDIYRPFGYAGAFARDRASLSYMASLSPTLRLLLIDVNDSIEGEVDSQTLAWAEEQLAQAKRDGCRVIAVSHQNLLRHNDMFSYGFTIDNAWALQALYADAPVLCSLSGHIHMQHISESEAGLRDIATSSLAVSPNQYGVLTLTESELSYRTETVNVSAWAAERGLTDPNLVDFAGYSEAFFMQNARRQALAKVTQDDQPEQLADFFAELNTAYFAGRMDAFVPDEQLLERWRKETAFLARYIDSIVQEPPRNHCALTLALDAPGE